MEERFAAGVADFCRHLHPDAAKLATDVSAMISDRELDGWNSLDAITRSRPLVDLADDRFYGDADWKKSVREKITRHFADRAPRPPLATAAAFARAFLLTEPIAPVARP